MVKIGCTINMQINKDSYTIWYESSYQKKIFFFCIYTVYYAVLHSYFIQSTESVLQIYTYNISHISSKIHFLLRTFFNSSFFFFKFNFYFFLIKLSFFLLLISHPFFPVENRFFRHFIISSSQPVFWLPTIHDYESLILK